MKLWKKYDKMFESMDANLMVLYLADNCADIA